MVAVVALEGCEPWAPRLVQTWVVQPTGNTVVEQVSCLVLAVVAGAMVVVVPTHVLVAGVSVVQEPKVVHHLSMEAPAPMELLFSKMEALAPMEMHGVLGEECLAPERV